MLVLVVEHDAETQNSISLNVEAAGHNCFCVPSEEDACTWLQSSCPDIVLVDLLLPDSDHRQFSKRIQALAPNAKIIVLSRSGSNDAVREALNWGAIDYLEKPVSGLRLQCILKHLSELRPQATVHSCHPNAFFNGDEHAYKMALSKFKKALKLNIPIVFEGAPGTGKATAAKHFLQQTCPEMPAFWFDARTETLEDFRNTICELDCSNKTRRSGIVIQHMEAASKALQHDLKLQLNKPNQIIVATSSGRLMDHMEHGVLDPVLFSKMSAAPFWLSPLSERKHDADIIGRHFLKLANTELHSNLPNSIILKENGSLPRAFPDNFRGLKKSVYSIVADQKPTSAEMKVRDCPKRPQTHSKPALSKPMSIDLLDEAGEFRSMEAIEADAIRFAFLHLDGRLGKIAKALQLGRTTLYRKLIKLKLAKTDAQTTGEQNSGFVHLHDKKVTARAA